MSGQENQPESFGHGVYPHQNTSSSSPSSAYHQYTHAGQSTQPHQHGQPHQTPRSYHGDPYQAQHSLSYTAPSPYYGNAFPGDSMRTLPRYVPEPVRFEPLRGTAGITLHVYLRSLEDFAAYTSLYFAITFREKSRQGTVTRLPYTDSFQYSLSVEVPSLETPISTEVIPLYLSIKDHRNQNVDFVTLGNFSYESADQSQTSNSPASFSRKRKTSSESISSYSVPSKKASVSQLQYASQEPSLRSGGSPSSLSRKPSTQRMENINPVYPGVTQEAPAGGSPDAISNPSQVKPKPLKIEAAQNYPPLYRTSTLQTSSTPSRTSIGQQSQTFNPYGIYPGKAELMIEGSLESMLDNWSEVETQTKRRLVEFERSRTNNTIATSFKPVTLEQRKPNSICVSCIWWEEKQEAFITSVDMIYLLESLVAVRFTVEEKNRIRRNLEGFHPLTVAKGREESDDFFRKIMSYPNPKPRNIEKDVKVFPWLILSSALKKIIGKYSSSYSSTAGHLYPQSGSSFGGRGSPLDQSEYSPGSATGLGIAVPPGRMTSGPTALTPGAHNLMMTGTGSPHSPHYALDASGAYVPAYGPWQGQQWNQTQPPRSVQGTPTNQYPGQYHFAPYMNNVQSPAPTSSGTYFYSQPNSQPPQEEGDQYNPGGGVYLPYHQNPR